MITKITVESFKSLESVEVELGAVNVFVGANGSGKSNLLEAVGVLGAAAFGRVDDESLLRRGVRPGVPQLYKSAFPTTRADRRPHIFFGAENSAARYEVSLWNPIKDPDPAWRFKTENLWTEGKRLIDRAPYRKPTKGVLNAEQGYAALKSVELSETDPATGLLELLRNYAIYCANTPTLRGLAQDQQPREPLGLSGGRLPDAISELFRSRSQESNEWLHDYVLQICPLIDWAERFGWAPSKSMPLSPSAATTPRVVRFVDRFMKESRNLLSGYDASEGALYILFAAVLILHPRSPRFLAIDNFDQGLNPRLARRLAAAFCSWALGYKTERQVLLTSHNPAVLDGLPLQNDRVRLFVVDRDNRGHTVVKRVELSEALLSKAKEGWTLSRLWVNGLIGGVPDV
ncbi:MAG: AAA family ATPase [Candidatus Sulfotelmatobacter sp.]|jgi:energy-coupling factor transporter ATP-binding protein EcfA2